jgi:hypothetical protein
MKILSFGMDLQASGGRPLAELVEIGRRPFDAAKRYRRDIRADQEKIGAELLHDVELALGPVEGASPQRFRHALEIAERLEQGDLEPIIAHHPPDIRRRPVKRQKVVLEDLNPVKPGARNRLKLLRQLTADRYRRYRGLHRSPLLQIHPPCQAQPLQ